MKADEHWSCGWRVKKCIRRIFVMSDLRLDKRKAKGIINLANKTEQVLVWTVGRACVPLRVALF